MAFTNNKKSLPSKGGAQRAEGISVPTPRAEGITRQQSAQGKSLPSKGGARRAEGIKHPKYGSHHYTFPANIKLVDRSKKMAKKMTKAEKIMWFEILKKTNIKWIKQKIIGNYIVDFVAFKVKFVIEVDDQSHNNRVLYDNQRTKFLETMGIKVIRYTNQQVINNTQVVFEDIVNKLQSASSIPSPTSSVLP